MKRTFIVAIALLTLGGCGTPSGRSYVSQIPVIDSQGVKTYLLGSGTFNFGVGKERSLEILADKANSICKSGYELINEEFIDVPTGALGLNMGKQAITWQIKCKSPEQAS
jgi:hypothetical protein